VNNETTELTSAYPLGTYSYEITEDDYSYIGRTKIRAVVYGWVVNNGDEGFSLSVRNTFFINLYRKGFLFI
jgi:hypothetical protein